MQWLYAISLALGLLGLLGIAACGVYVAFTFYVDHRLASAGEAAKASSLRAATVAAALEAELAIDYAPSTKQWSGFTVGELPLKMLTYRQYECLEDARYGFTIVGVTKLEKHHVQPLKTRAHGKKTVTSLAKHGFLVGDDEQGFSITDHGLNALVVCSVRY